MTVGILLPLILVPVATIAVYAIYRSSMKRLSPDEQPRQLSGTRLTAEHLRQLESPPWRIVHEIAADALGDVDHVAIGPPGVIAITTLMADRPPQPPEHTPQAAAASAITRSGVDELTARVGIPCDRLAKVFWGAPRSDASAAVELLPDTFAVEGQRLAEWLRSLPNDVLTKGEVDLAWQAVVTGIGRPDPLP